MKPLNKARASALRFSNWDSAAFSGIFWLRVFHASKHYRHPLTETIT
jgi:hypothetical protein